MTSLSRGVSRWDTCVRPVGHVRPSGRSPLLPDPTRPDPTRKTPSSRLFIISTSFVTRGGETR